MGNQLQDQAIEAALNKEWETAISLNQAYLAECPAHIPTLNRLAKAYKEIGCIEEAITTYQTVINLDRYNVIAKKNLDILIKNPPVNHKKHNSGKTITEFIKEPGKAKTFCLTRLGDPKIIANLTPGEIVYLIPKKHTFFLITETHEHVGALTDDTAFELKRQLLEGAQFEVIIKSASINGVVIFVKETMSSKPQPQSSFLS
jgi:hypothetical protein